MNLIFLFILFQSFVFASCEPSGQDGSLSFEDFPWNIDLVQVQKNADNLYRSPQRLKDRAYKVGSRILLPIETPNGLVPVELKTDFLQRVTSHIEFMLKNNYADVVNFSDLGHSHFLIPEDYYLKEIDKIKPDKIDQAYKKIFNHSENLILYHTAEQIQFFDEDGNSLNDRYLQWRYYTRNILAENKIGGKIYPVQNLESKYNTLKGLGGYRFWGAGFYISANQDGCFSYRHNDVIFNYDINFSGL